MKTAVASVVAATVASACCIGPVVFVLLGVGTFGASLAALETYRSIFIAITTVLLGMAFYAAYRPVEDCGVCLPPTRRRARIAVWIAAMCVSVLVAFPYYVGFLFYRKLALRMVLVLVGLLASGIVSRAAQAPATNSKPATKVCTLKVTGMTCAGCEAAVKIAAKKIDGVTNVTISYAKAAAQVTYDPAKTTPDAIAKVIREKTGYKAEAPHPST
jgi:mercuric ion transport protein